VEVASNLDEEDPSKVNYWISTGSTWLDSTIAQGVRGGIPVGRISIIAGASSSGKSFMAGLVAANAQKMGIDVVYFDTEATMEREFLHKLGCDTSRILYIQPPSVEFVFETIQQLITQTDGKYLFIWDSYANTPCSADAEGTFNPNETMALKPRITNKAMQKLTIPLSKSESTLLIVNQLKTNLNPTGNIKYLTDSERYTMPGGMTIRYPASLVVWLTAKRGKESIILDEKGYNIGYEMKARLEKSKFGTTGRESFYKILHIGEELGVMDDESIFEAIKENCEHLVQSGAWYALKFEDGTEEKFQGKAWNEKMKNEKFRSRVLQIVHEEIVVKFATKTGDASRFYNLEKKEEYTTVEDLVE
jgi:RecA/RadA recombinase